MELILTSHGWPWGGFFFLFWFGLIAILLLFKVSFWRRHGWCHYAHEGGAPPEAILKRRLASGEIDEADYERLLAKVRR